MIYNIIKFIFNIRGLNFEKQDYFRIRNNIRDNIRELQRNYLREPLRNLSKLHRDCVRKFVRSFRFR